MDVKSESGNIEIERKWLVSGFLDEHLNCIHSAVVKQGYISTAPAVRIRSAESGGKTNYVLCFKGKGTLCRKEFEMELTKEQFDELCTFLCGELVVKNYKVYKLSGGETLEVSLVDEGKPTSFYYAEVEFDSVEKAENFIPPAFLGEEKTHDENFSMSSYWKKTRSAI